MPIDAQNAVLYMMLLSKSDDRKYGELLDKLDQCLNHIEDLAQGSWQPTPIQNMSTYEDILLSYELTGTNSNCSGDLSAIGSSSRFVHMRSSTNSLVYVFLVGLSCVPLFNII